MAYLNKDEQGVAANRYECRFGGGLLEVFENKDEKRVALSRHG